MVGFKAPQNEWQCAQIARSSENWGGDKFKSMVNWQGPYKMLADHAVTYANQYKLKVNYIYLDVPVTVQAGVFATDAFTNAYMNFYQCKYPPAASNKIL